MRTALLALLLVGSASTVALAQAPADITWGPAPPFFPAGARFAVLQGDPSKEGVYTVRLEMPAGYYIAPHMHPTDEDVTVISGSLELGMGDAPNAATAMTLPAGGFAVAPAATHHYARAKAATVVQVHGMGPFAITYVDAKDDPRSHP